jgi:cytochrome c oxidase cbb3-type subunit III
MSEGASLFVIVFTLVNIVACLWLMWWTARTRTAKDHGDSTSAGAGKTGHVWDGDLEELNNPLPLWWLGLFILTILFAFAYLIYFPGLGNFTGQGKWSQVGAWEQDMQQRQAQLEQRLASVKDKNLHDLAKDASAMSMARNLFGANCSTCHGSDARGAKGFPNLADNDWLWGSAENTVLESISNGRHGVMPGWESALGDQGLNEVASYVVSLSGREAPNDWIAAGEKRFATMCAACHGAGGTGNQLLGAPNLADKVWLYGGDFNTVRATIAKGRENQMPAHTELLGDTKVRLLAAYVLSLSQPPEAVAQQASTSQAEAQGGANGGSP